MRYVVAALQAKLDAGATTLCHCWILRRKDDGVIGFTDHDVDVVIDGVTCRAKTGLAASEVTSRFDLSVDGGEISGALADAALSEADLAAGRYDAASVETWLVDWSDSALRMLHAKAVIGEVKRQGQAFSAELRGLADALAQESGRLFTASCGADLGDHRCKVDLSLSSLRGAGSVVALRATSSFVVSGLAAFEDRLFSAGRLSWLSGANAGLTMEVKEHRNDSDEVQVTLWQAMAEPVSAGDAFTVTAGCDKQFATCRDRFGNSANFRGFPHIPGNDFLIRYPIAGEPGHSGASFKS